MPIKQLISGGQTGVDRAALDVALEFGIRCGGWCPRGRKAEDGPIDRKYPLWETPSARYADRTEWNVRVGDATLILSIGSPTGGTALTKKLADDFGKPCLIVDLDQPAETATVLQWLAEHAVRTINVAGPRESTSPGVFRKSQTYLRRLLADYRTT
ncbi:MAG: molybdenum cofactor carrier [Planctomycetaceae bacterium]|nr:molybdenum cofactor carrier [Planctomycetaceae bacterium]MBT6158051.1 molybdenum cofactor carrier [Planctomycetaceae bacterium]MBT6486509.1 molybdenum cofactor carrier [Planctomycetaceae bacterium]MBT6495832.1 molybdenum cofactor carrier [Planctomycetaceae bacterium]